MNSKFDYHQITCFTHRRSHVRLCRTEILLLIRDEETRNRRTRECTNRTREHSRDSDPRHITTTARRDLRQDTDLVTQRADVGKTTEGIGDNQARAVGEVSVGLCVLEGIVGDEFVLCQSVRKEGNQRILWGSVQYIPRLVSDQLTGPP